MADLLLAATESVIKWSVIILLISSSGLLLIRVSEIVRKAIKEFPEYYDDLMIESGDMVEISDVEEL